MLLQHTLFVSEDWNIEKIERFIWTLSAIEGHVQEAENCCYQTDIVSPSSTHNI